MKKRKKRAKKEPGYVFDIVGFISIRDFLAYDWSEPPFDIIWYPTRCTIDTREPRYPVRILLKALPEDTDLCFYDPYKALERLAPELNVSIKYCWQAEDEAAIKEMVGNFVLFRNTGLDVRSYFAHTDSIILSYANA